MKDYAYLWVSFDRESEGSFQYGNYRREAEDLRAVVQHFCEKKRVITAILGHSKGGASFGYIAFFFHLFDICHVRFHMSNIWWAA